MFRATFGANLVFWFGYAGSVLDLVVSTVLSLFIVLVLVEVFAVGGVGLFWFRMRFLDFGGFGILVIFCVVFCWNWWFGRMWSSGLGSLVFLGGL